MSVLSGRHRIMGTTQFGALVMTVLEHSCLALDHGFRLCQYCGGGTNAGVDLKYVVLVTKEKKKTQTATSRRKF